MAIFLVDGAKMCKK